MTLTEAHAAALLRASGCRATRCRVAILRSLAADPAPRSVPRLVAGVAGVADKVTVYRTLRTLEAAGVVRAVDLRHAHAHYELVAGRQHHHHIVCRSCGAIEEVALGDERVIEAQALARAERFAFVTDHALEFFGVCKRCAGHDAVRVV